MVRAHRLAVDALRSGPGDFPVGLTLSMAEMVAGEGGEGARDAAEEIAGGHLPGGHRRRRLHRRPVLHPAALRTRRAAARAAEGVPVTQMGYEYWPQVVEYTVRRAAAVTGLPVLVTENGIGTDDDRQRIDYVSRGPAAACALPRRRRRRPGLLRLEPARQLRVGPRATGRRSAWWRWTGRPSSAGPSRAPSGSARWPGPTRLAPPAVTGRCQADRQGPGRVAPWPNRSQLPAIKHVWRSDESLWARGQIIHTRRARRSAKYTWSRSSRPWSPR